MPTFRFRLIPFIVTVLLVILGGSLAFWQQQRAWHKEAIEQTLQERERMSAIEFPTSVDINQMEYSRVILKGEFVKDWPIYLDNRPMNRVVGMDVLMPFKIEGSPRYVLVARGWLPRNAQDRQAIKPYATPSGVIQIEGILKAQSSHVLQLGESEPLLPNTLVQNVDINAFSAASQLPMYSFIVEQTSDINDGLARDWPRASMGSERHRGYAFQWLALAGTALLFFLVTGFKGTKK